MIMIIIIYINKLISINTFSVMIPLLVLQFKKKNHHFIITSNCRLFQLDDLKWVHLELEKVKITGNSIKASNATSDGC